MSLQFSDTTTYKGIVQLYERELGFDRGYISGNTERLKQFTADVNIAYDHFLELAFETEGRWQFDDSNHTDYPIITTNLVANQRDYTFTSDENGNLILDIYKVFIQEQNDGYYNEVYQVDTSRDYGLDDFTSGLDVTGIPYRYDKMANGIFLDPIPGYNQTNGLKLYVNREASYFTYTDTTKKPGVPGTLHDYFYLKPAFEYATRKSLANLGSVAAKLAASEERIIKNFTRRERDTKKVLRPRITNFI